MELQLKNGLIKEVTLSDSKLITFHYKKLEDGSENSFSPLFPPKFTDEKDWLESKGKYLQVKWVDGAEYITITDKPI
jgi:hypothetical protein